MIDNLILLAITRMPVFVQIKHLLQQFPLPSEDTETAVTFCLRYYNRTGVLPTIAEYATVGIHIQPNKDITDQFLVEQIYSHFRKVAIEDFLASSVKEFDSEVLNPEKALIKFNKIIQATSKIDVGTVLNENVASHVKDAVVFIDRERISVGLNGVDNKIGGGVGKQEVLFFVAPPGRGKTTFLINVFYNGLLQGWNGLFLTLELSEASIKERFFRRVIYGKRKELREIDKATHIIERMFRLSDATAMLKYERPNKVTVENLEELIYKIKMIVGINLDFMCIDYVDKLAPSSHVRKFEVRHQLREIVNDLRNLAVEYDIAIASASQANRESVRNGRVTETGIAESYAKVEAADIILALNNPQIEADSSSASPLEVTPDDNVDDMMPQTLKVLPKVINILKNRDHPVFNGDIPIFIISDMMLMSDNINILPPEVFQ